MSLRSYATVCVAQTSLCSKQFQKILTKQGIKFKLNTKVLSADKVDGKVVVNTQSAKGDKEETVSRGWSARMLFERLTLSISARSRRRLGCSWSSSIYGGSQP